MPLVTRRLILRQPAIEDAPVVARLLCRRSMSRSLGAVPYPYTPWHARAFLKPAAAAEASGGDMARAIVLRANPRILVGIVGLREIDTLTLSIGYWIGEPYQGFGLATEAARAMVAFAFDERKVDTVIATALPENMASHRVLRAVGLKRQMRRQLASVRSQRRKLWVTTFRLERQEWDERLRRPPGPGRVLASMLLRRPALLDNPSCI